MTQTPPSIVGMVDDLGRPATIFTPPEVLRRDPSRWPTPDEFVAEWERYTPEQRTALAERILRDAQDVETLRRGNDVACGRFEAAEARVIELRSDVAHLTNVNADLTRELATVRATLDEERRFHELRSEALNRTGADSDRLRAKVARVEKVALMFEQDKYTDWRADDVANEIRAALEPQEPARD